ncbi:glycosyl transferase [Saccharobesus litoralis]|uniref:Glycosyl transferase n=1 Tax=Saccharobesus litoralis TaxID=2172099 RepID=A0A2S0VMG4_9ALTE|nr:glycosyltransferase [Saccharobesus litoralis]AWB65369.1 glycosyl transferase [Saccharobesus litoralis]
MQITVQVVQRLSPGGIETMALDLANSQAADQQQANYIISLEGNLSELIKDWPKLKPYRQQIICLNKPQGWSYTTVKQLHQLLLLLKANCVHTHHIGPLIYGGLAARLAGIRHLIHTEHDAWHLQNTKRRWLQNCILQITRPTFVADSNLVAQQAKQLLNYQNIKVIYNGIDTSRFTFGAKQAAREQFNLPSNVSLIGCAGRLEAVKGQAVLIDALSQLPEHIHLAIAGQGSCLEKLQQQTQRLGLSQRVHFVGLIDDMPRFYQSLDVFCLPSFNEGFPLAALEAQACGIPVVMTKTGATSEAICPEFSQLVPPGDSLDMAKALNELITRLNDFNPDSVDANTRAQIKTIAETHRQFVMKFASLKQMLSAYQALKA